MRKIVFTSVKEKMTLTDFSRKIINTHHLPKIPTIPPKNIMACLALMYTPSRRGKQRSEQAEIDAAPHWW
ncbi:hypothetical protein B0H10DRAFT_2448277 [Mycena sp. CBHHK59/15]|nr:hypothetical protein B0H10DRAFT_2448277 [Mycena sp. CBHHK59/15]